MILFDNKDYERFFNPLSCKNKKIYYECITKLIEKSKQVPLLYESDARNTLTLYFRNITYAVEDESNSEMVDEVISSKKSETENANAVLRYLRHCGWISKQELGRNGDNIASVTPYCRQIIESIEKIFNRDTNAVLTNHIFAIYDILLTAFNSEHARNITPYKSILEPVSESVDALRNELLILKDSISSVMRTVIKLTETNQLGQFLIRDEMLKQFFSDYFFIKKDGLIPGYIEEIEKMLRNLVGEATYEKMIVEYQNTKRVTPLQAREAVNAEIERIKSFLRYEYVKEMDYIDKKINSYYKLYSTRIYMVMSNNVNMQNYLNELLMTIKTYDKDQREIILSKISESFMLNSYKYVGQKSIERRKKRKPNTKSSAILSTTLSEEERKRLTEELLYEYPDRYGVKQTSEFFDSLLKDCDYIIPDSTIVKTRDDAMMIAASVIYSGSDEFGYEVEFLGGAIETEVATISNVIIKRKNK